jgi:hypothetical protein
MSKAQKKPQVSSQAKPRASSADRIHLNLLAASILSGLLSSGRSNRAEELVEQAFNYANEIIQYNNNK